jgi:hypothetical protein
MKLRHFSSIFITALLLTATLVSPAGAKKKTSKAHPKFFVLDVSLGLTYDDNIIRFSEADLGLFGTDTLESKFSVKSKTDWIVAPQIRPRIQGRFIANQPASLTLGYDYFGYVKNDIRRYSRFLVELQQNFMSRGYAKLTFGITPKYYYRNLFLYHDTTGFDIYIPAKFSKNNIQAELGYDITRNIKGAVSYQYQKKSFNHEFKYRDQNVNILSASGNWRALKILKVWAEYDYENNKAHGADMADTIPDFSYIAWDITLGARHYSRLLLTLKPEIYASFQYRHTAYQSSRIPRLLNTTHVFEYGRNDNNYLIRLGTAWQIPYRLRLEADYAFMQKKANLPDIYPIPLINVIQTTAELERKLNYKANTVTLRISRQF